MVGKNGIFSPNKNDLIGSPNPLFLVAYRPCSALIRRKSNQSERLFVLQTARLSAFVLTLAERGLLLRSKGALFPLHSAWSLRLASLAHGRVAESQSGETLEIPYSALLGFATAPGFLLRASTIYCVVVGGDPRTPLLCCPRPAWPLCSAWPSSACVRVGLS